MAKKKTEVTETESAISNDRLSVLKTYKIYIGGKFPRTESGRYYTITDKSGKNMGNMCLCSRKDVRDAVVAARSALGGWASASAFNRSQVIYRIAEMLEGRRAQFLSEMQLQGLSEKEAVLEINASIDRIIYYAGWADKFQQVFSAVNPVASSHFNFSVQEPMGVIGALAPQNSALLGLVTAIMPIITGGNTCVVLASEKMPLCAVTFAEVLNSSDVPGGIVNILTGSLAELHKHFASHMDVNAVSYYGDDLSVIKTIQETAAINVKRALIYKGLDLQTEKAQNPYLILDTQETKTTWHPIENISGASGGY